MAVYSAYKVSAQTRLAESNMFSRMMSYGMALNTGAATPPNMALQSNLIYVAANANDEQGSEAIDLIGRYRLNIDLQDGYVVNNYWNNGY